MNNVNANSNNNVQTKTMPAMSGFTDAMQERFIDANQYLKGYNTLITFLNTKAQDINAGRNSQNGVPAVMQRSNFKISKSLYDMLYPKNVQALTSKRNSAVSVYQNAINNALVANKDVHVKIPAKEYSKYVTFHNFRKAMARGEADFSKLSPATNLVTFDIIGHGSNDMLGFSLTRSYFDSQGKLHTVNESRLSGIKAGTILDKKVKELSKLINEDRISTHTLEKYGLKDVYNYVMSVGINALEDSDNKKIKISQMHMDPATYSLADFNYQHFDINHSDFISKNEELKYFKAGRRILHRLGKEQNAVFGRNFHSDVLKEIFNQYSGDNNIVVSEANQIKLLNDFAVKSKFKGGIEELIGKRLIEADEISKIDIHGQSLGMFDYEVNEAFKGDYDNIQAKLADVDNYKAILEPNRSGRINYRKETAKNFAANNNFFLYATDKSGKTVKASNSVVVSGQNDVRSINKTFFKLYDKGAQFVIDGFGSFNPSDEFINLIGGQNFLLDKEGNQVLVNGNPVIDKKSVHPLFQSKDKNLVELRLKNINGTDDEFLNVVTSRESFEKGNFFKEFGIVGVIDNNGNREYTKYKQTQIDSNKGITPIDIKLPEIQARGMGNPDAYTHLDFGLSDSELLTEIMDQNSKFRKDINTTNPETMALNQKAVLWETLSSFEQNFKQNYLDTNTFFVDNAFLEEAHKELKGIVKDVRENINDMEPLDILRKFREFYIDNDLQRYKLPEVKQKVATIPRNYTTENASALESLLINFMAGGEDQRRLLENQLGGLLNENLYSNGKLEYKQRMALYDIQRNGMVDLAKSYAKYINDNGIELRYGQGKIQMRMPGEMEFKDFTDKIQRLTVENGMAFTHIGNNTYVQHVQRQIDNKKGGLVLRSNLGDLAAEYLFNPINLNKARRGMPIDNDTPLEIFNRQLSNITKGMDKSVFKSYEQARYASSLMSEKHQYTTEKGLYNLFGFLKNKQYEYITGFGSKDKDKNFINSEILDKNLLLEIIREHKVLGDNLPKHKYEKAKDLVKKLGLENYNGDELENVLKDDARLALVRNDENFTNVRLKKDLLKLIKKDQYSLTSKEDKQRINKLINHLGYGDSKTNTQYSRKDIVKLLFQDATVKVDEELEFVGLLNKRAKNKMSEYDFIRYNKLAAKLKINKDNELQRIAEIRKNVEEAKKNGKELITVSSVVPMESGRTSFMNMLEEQFGDQRFVKAYEKKYGEGSYAKNYKKINEQIKLTRQVVGKNGQLEYITKTYDEFINEEADKILADEKERRIVYNKTRGKDEKGVQFLEEPEAQRIRRAKHSAYHRYSDFYYRNIGNADFANHPLFEVFQEAYGNFDPENIIKSTMNNEIIKFRAGGILPTSATVHIKNAQGKTENVKFEDRNTGHADQVSFRISMLDSYAGHESMENTNREINTIRKKGAVEFYEKDVVDRLKAMFGPGYDPHDAPGFMTEHEMFYNGISGRTTHVAGKSWQLSTAGKDYWIESVDKYAQGLDIYGTNGGARRNELKALLEANYHAHEGGGMLMGKFVDAMGYTNNQFTKRTEVNMPEVKLDSNGKVVYTKEFLDRKLIRADNALFEMFSEYEGEYKAVKEAREAMIMNNTVISNGMAVSEKELNDIIDKHIQGELGGKVLSIQDKEAYVKSLFERRVLEYGKTARTLRQRNNMKFETGYLEKVSGTVPLLPLGKMLAGEKAGDVLEVFDKTIFRKNGPIDLKSGVLHIDDYNNFKQALWNEDFAKNDVVWSNYAESLKKARELLEKKGINQRIMSEVLDKNRYLVDTYAELFTGEKLTHIDFTRGNAFKHEGAALMMPRIAKAMLKNGVDLKTVNEVFNKSLNAISPGSDKKDERYKINVDEHGRIILPNKDSRVSYNYEDLKELALEKIQEVKSGYSKDDFNNFLHADIVDETVAIIRDNNAFYNMATPLGIREQIGKMSLLMSDENRYAVYQALGKEKYNDLFRNLATEDFGKPVWESYMEEFNTHSTYMDLENWKKNSKLSEIINELSEDEKFYAENNIGTDQLVSKDRIKSLAAESNISALVKEAETFAKNKKYPSDFNEAKHTTAMFNKYEKFTSDFSSPGDFLTNLKNYRSVVDDPRISIYEKNNKVNLINNELGLDKNFFKQLQEKTGLPLASGELYIPMTDRAMGSNPSTITLPKYTEEAMRILADIQGYTRSQEKNLQRSGNYDPNRLNDLSERLAADFTNYYDELKNTIKKGGEVYNRINKRPVFGSAQRKHHAVDVAELRYNTTGRLKTGEAIKEVFGGMKYNGESFLKLWSEDHNKGKFAGPSFAVFSTSQDTLNSFGFTQEYFEELAKMGKFEGKNLKDQARNAKKAWLEEVKVNGIRGESIRRPIDYKNSVRDVQIYFSDHLLSDVVLSDSVSSAFEKADDDGDFMLGYAHSILSKDSKKPILDSASYNILAGRGADLSSYEDNANRLEKVHNRSMAIQMATYEEAAGASEYSKEKMAAEMKFYDAQANKSRNSFADTVKDYEKKINSKLEFGKINSDQHKYLTGSDRQRALKAWNVGMDQVSDYVFHGETYDSIKKNYITAMQSIADSGDTEKVKAENIKALQDRFSTFMGENSEGNKFFKNKSELQNQFRLASDRTKKNIMHDIIEHSEQDWGVKIDKEVIGKMQTGISEHNRLVQPLLANLSKFGQAQVSGVDTAFNVIDVLRTFDAAKPDSSRLLSQRQANSLQLLREIFKEEFATPKKADKLGELARQNFIDTFQDNMDKLFSNKSSQKDRAQAKQELITSGYKYGRDLGGSRYKIDKLLLNDNGKAMNMHEILEEGFNAAEILFKNVNQKGLGVNQIATMQKKLKEYDFSVEHGKAIYEGQVIANGNNTNFKVNLWSDQRMTQTVSLAKAAKAKAFNFARKFKGVMPVAMTVAQQAQENVAKEAAKRAMREQRITQSSFANAANKVVNTAHYSPNVGHSTGTSTPAMGQEAANYSAPAPQRPSFTDSVITPNAQRIPEGRMVQIKALAGGNATKALTTGALTASIMSMAAGQHTNMNVNYNTTQNTNKEDVNRFIQQELYYDN